MKKVHSADNPRYKALHKLLHSSRERRQQGLSLLDGVHLIAAYRDHVGMPEQVIVNPSGLDDPEIAALLGTLAPCDPLLLSDALFRQLSSVVSPSGVIAAIRTPRPAVVAAAIDACVMLEGIQDPGNLGSLLRTAAAAGIQHVLLSKHSVHAWSPRVLRAGMGAHFLLQIHEQCDLLRLARAFEGKVIATSHRAGKSVFDADLTGKVALLFGNEGAGLSDALANAAHNVIAIPMPGKTDSLNVAAAVAVCLFERVRQLRASVRPSAAGS